MDGQPMDRRRQAWPGLILGLRLGLHFFTLNVIAIRTMKYDICLKHYNRISLKCAPALI